MDLFTVQLLSAVTLFLLSVIFTIAIPLYILKPRVGFQNVPIYDVNEDGFHVRDSQIYSELSDDSNLSRLQNYNDASLLIPQNDSRLKALWKKISKYNLISGINCFCGGLFLGICLLDMIPSAQQDVAEVVKLSNLQLNYPIAEFFISIGLLLVIFIEVMMLTCCQINPHNHDITSSNNPHHFDSEQETTEATRALVLIVTLIFHSVFEGMALGFADTTANVLQLLLVLSLHKCPFGFGIGMKLFETIGRTRKLLSVISCMLFCLASPLGCIIGIILSKASFKPSTGLTSVYTINSTFAETDELSSVLVLKMIFSCLVAGTFVYITFVEVIPSEFSHHDHHTPSTENLLRPPKISIPKFMKLVLLVLGFALTSGLQFLDG